MSTVGKLVVYGIVIVALVAFGCWLTTVIWHWVVPDVFHVAVERELLPSTITLWQAFKLSVLLWLGLGISRTGSSSSKS